MENKATSCQDYFIRKIYNCDSVEMAEYLGYSQFNINLLKAVDDEAIKAIDPQLYNQVLNQAHCRDSRSVHDFISSMISNWLWEDIIGNELSSDDLVLENNGTDANRTFSPHPTNAADFRVWYNGQYYNVELQINYSKQFLNDGIMKIRDNKFNNMKKDKDLFLVVNLYNKIGLTIIDMTQPIENAKYTDNIPEFNKPGYYLDMTKCQFYKFDKHGFKQAFKKAIQNRM